MFPADGSAEAQFGGTLAIASNTIIIGADHDDDKGYNSGSAYIFQTNGNEWSEEAKLLAPDGGRYHNFGGAIGILNNSAIVGAIGDDQNGQSSGAAYIFSDYGSGWELETKLPFKGVVDDRFGASVALAENAILIGSRFDDENGKSAGSVYSFGFDGTNWNELAKLIPDDSDAGDRFGCSLALSDNFAIVGATGDDDRGENSGSAYIFKGMESQWIQQSKLIALDGQQFSDFGNAVAISGPVAVIGVEGDRANGIDSGAAYVFRSEGMNWIEKTKLTPDDPASGDLFGSSIAIQDNLIAIGARLNDENGDHAGAAYIFRHNGVEWLQEAKIMADATSEGDQFGSAIAILDPSTLIVGAPLHEYLGETTGAAHIFRYIDNRWVEFQTLLAGDGEHYDQFGVSFALSRNNIMIGSQSRSRYWHRTGAVYVFASNGSIWIENAKIVPAEGQTGDSFGASMSALDNAILIGAPNQDDNGRDAGTAYIFELNCDNTICLNLQVTNLNAGGRARFEITQGTPNTKAITIFGSTTGRTTIQDYSGYCVTFGIRGINRNKIIGGSNRTFDSDGQVTFDLQVPPNFAGRQLLFQSAQHGTCPDECMSNIVQAVVQ